MKTLLLLCLLYTSAIPAQKPVQPNAHHIALNSRVFIEPMDGFETYLSAAIIKKNVPLTVVDDRARADYIITGNAHVDKANWAKILTISGAPQAGASVSIKDAKTGDMVYAYAVDKFNSARANQSTAEACAKHIKHDIEAGTKW